MPTYHAIGDALVTRDELVEKAATGEVGEFVRAIEERPDDATLEFSTGMATADNLLGGPAMTRSSTRATFESIALNKPLTIEIRHIYTGQYPTPSFFKDTKDMLVTSAMKSLATFNAAPRAINYLKSQVSPKSNISIPAATEQGTPLISYVPALTDASNVLTLEVTFDTFPAEVIGSIANMFSKAAGIPIFALQSSYLLAAGTLINIVNRFARGLFERTPIFSTSEELSFDRPGSIIPQADFRLITDRPWDNHTRTQYRLNEDGQLIHIQQGNVYSGSLPYIVISLDGRARKEYEQFTPTAASAALLGRFYNVTEGQDQPLEPLLDALRLYNDWQFRLKADTLSKQITKLDSNSDEYRESKNKYDGLVANILNEALKPQ